MKKFLGILFLIIFLSFLIRVDFSFAQNYHSLEIYFFYSALCPVCIEQKKFLDELEKKYPEIKINRYEIIRVPENQELLRDFYEKYKVPGREQGLVPVTFIAENYFVGFNEKIAEDIEGCVRECLFGEEREVSQIIEIPFFGQVDLSKLSLPLLTVTVAALDGINPCAMWILLFLITLLINVRSRKRIWLIGGIFIATSGIFYYLILAAWLNLFLAIRYVDLTRIIIGAVALGVGIWQIKNFITYHPGVCRVIGITSKIEKKLQLRERAEKIVTAPLGLGMIAGVIVLALGVNLIEFFCSAGLPAIYTQILALNPMPDLSYYLYLLLYTFVFMLDDLIVFSLAVITLTKMGFTEKYNYWATLFGGILILILGILLIFKPEFLMFVGF